MRITNSYGPRDKGGPSLAATGKEVSGGGGGAKIVFEVRNALDYLSFVLNERRNFSPRISAASKCEFFLEASSADMLLSGEEEGAGEGRNDLEEHLSPYGPFLLPSLYYKAASSNVNNIN